MTEGQMIKIPVAHRIDPEKDGFGLNEFILQCRPRLMSVRWFDYVKSLPQGEGAAKSNALLAALREAEL